MFETWSFLKNLNEKFKNAKKIYYFLLCWIFMFGSNFIFDMVNGKRESNNYYHYFVFFFGIIIVYFLVIKNIPIFIQWVIIYIYFFASLNLLSVYVVHDYADYTTLIIYGILAFVISLLYLWVAYVLKEGRFK